MEGCRADIDTYCDQVTPGEQRLHGLHLRP